MYVAANESVTVWIVRSKLFLRAFKSRYRQLSITFFFLEVDWRDPRMFYSSVALLVEKVDCYITFNNTVWHHKSQRVPQFVVSLIIDCCGVLNTHFVETYFFVEQRLHRAPADLSPAERTNDCRLVITASKPFFFWLSSRLVSVRPFVLLIHSLPWIWHQTSFFSFLPAESGRRWLLLSWNGNLFDTWFLPNLFGSYCWFKRCTLFPKWLAHLFLICYQMFFRYDFFPEKEHFSNYLKHCFILLFRLAVDWARIFVILP